MQEKFIRVATGNRFRADLTDMPMDLADATLMLYAEKTGLNEIATIDSDFCVYRTAKKDYLKNVVW